MEQDSFDEIRRIEAHYNLLTFADFIETFQIQNNSRAFQLGAVINQKGKPIYFYIQKLIDSHQRYTVTEKNLIRIVETLKERRTILLGQNLIIYIDHKNLTYKNFNSNRLLIWIIILEEYGLDI